MSKNRTLERTTVERRLARSSVTTTAPDVCDDEADVQPRVPRDAGVTLTEILISIVLLGTLVSALLVAVQSSLGASSAAFDGAQIETVLLNASDRVSRAPQLCDYEAYVDAAALAEGWEVTTTSVSVEILVANTGDPSDWQPQTCPADVRPFDVQRLTISASNPSGTVSRTLTVVKSDVN
jgi:Tfp pilus assembly protein PilV